MTHHFHYNVYKSFISYILTTDFDIPATTHMSVLNISLTVN
jgi:hypothetical protein